MASRIAQRRQLAMDRHFQRECQPLPLPSSSLSGSYSPLKDEVEPVSNHSYPEELDAYSFTEVEPDGEEDVEGIPEVCDHRHQDEPILGVPVIDLEVVRGLDPKVMKSIHSVLHPYSLAPQAAFRGALAVSTDVVVIALLSACALPLFLYTLDAVCRSTQP